MKKIYLIVLFICALLKLPSYSNAQVVPNGVNFIFAADSSRHNCQVPDVSDIVVYGTAGGYLITDSVDIYINFGDGTDTSFKCLIGQQYFSAYFSKTWNVPGIFSQMFVVTGPDGDQDTIINQNAVYVASQCGNISGITYLDANNDCIYNAGDALLQYIGLKLFYNGTLMQTTWSDSSGEYYMSVPAGFTYTLEAGTAVSNLTTSCPVSGSYTISSFPAINQDFGLTCSQAGYDLTGYISGWGLRPNLQAVIYGYFGNMNCTVVSGTATVTLPTGVTYVSANPVPTTVSGNVLTYDANPYQPYYHYANYFNILVQCDPTLNIGDTLCFGLTLDPVINDLNPGDNSVSTCLPVRNSCDPNEKYEKIAQVGTANIAPNQLLDYTLNFQNLGNDDAYSIFILDTIDADLDFSTLEILASSHPMNVRMIGNSIMKFEFLNINLPAASVNEALSHGYVRYTIRPKSNLANGTVISNTAYIYFDFNAAVITNTVNNIVDLSSGINENSTVSFVAAYPNPAKDIITLRLGNENEAQIQILDISGRLIENKIVKNESQLNVNNLSAGTYFINIITDLKKTTEKLIIVK